MEGLRDWLIERVWKSSGVTGAKVTKTSIQLRSQRLRFQLRSQRLRFNWGHKDLDWTEVTHALCSRNHFCKARLTHREDKRDIFSSKLLRLTGGGLPVAALWSCSFFFFMNGNTERAQCALSRVCIPWEKEKKCNVKNKTIVKYLKRVIKNHAIWSLRWW